MKRSTRTLIAAAMFCAAALCAADAAPAKKSVYTKYQDWQFQPTTVEDADADGNVRHQMDFTVPLHGPWLTNPMPDGMTVTWITRIPCAGGIRYREKGTEEWTELWPEKYGQIDYSKDIHSYHLTGLKPGTEYEYRLMSNVDGYSTAYHMVISEGREIHSFKTIDPKRDSYKVFVTADFHGTARLCLDPLIDRSQANDADFYFFLGDNVEDGPGNNIRYYITFGFLDDITRKWGRSKPTVFLRGNHDIWGRDTYKYGDYFPQPNKRTYQAIAQGPALFICLDTMWPAREALQKKQYEKYLKEQADWIRTLRRTDVWKKSKFRIVMGHVAPFASEGTKFVGGAFNEVLSDNTPEGRVHLFLAGHEHAYRRINAGTKEIRFNNAYNDVKMKNYPPKYILRDPIPDNVPYTLVVCHLVEGMTIDVTPAKLTVKSHRWNRVEGGLYDAFEITPDGKVADLIKATVVPIVQPAPKAKK